MTINAGVIDPKVIALGTRYRVNNDLDDEFLESIRQKGILQPISVDQNLQLVAGGRRLAAALVLGLATIPYVQRHIEGELDLRECEAIENLYRKDMSWQERNALITRIHELMVEKHGEAWSQNKTADMLGKSVGSLSRIATLNKALTHFPALIKCKTEDDAVKLYRKLGEQVLVRHLVKQNVERDHGNLGNESKTKISKSNDGTSPPSSTENEEATTVPWGMRRAHWADNSYLVGDAHAGMQEMIDEGDRYNATLVEVDPPYGIDLQEAKKGDSKGLDVYNEVDKDQYEIFLETTCQYISTITPTNVRVIFWFAVEWYSEVKAALEKAGFKVDPIPNIWVKPTGQTASPDIYLARAYETFFSAWKGTAPPLRKRGRSNVFAFSPVPPSKKYHPTQRPIELMQEIYKTFAWPGSHILVPFLGSGVSLRAAWTLGIDGFGWDLSQEYHDQFIAQVERDLEAGLFNKIIDVEEDEREFVEGR